LGLTRSAVAASAGYKCSGFISAVHGYVLNQYRVDTIKNKIFQIH